jgi:hypothetical protein
MQSIYFWPDQPALSLLALWLVSAVALWAAREPMLRLLKGLGTHLEGALEALTRGCKRAADELRKRNRAALLAAGGLELQAKLEREFHRIESSFSERLTEYSQLHRRLDDLLQHLDGDFQKCGISPPEVPGWTTAVESIAGIPNSGDANVSKVLEGVRKSLHEAEKKSLQAYRNDTSNRHKILSGMKPMWREVRNLLTRMQESVGQALQTTAKVNGYVDDYERVRNDDYAAARALAYSATKLFLISLVVLGIACGGAFINFQLIALPMSELVPAGARLGGVPVATVSALVIVLMEVAVGMFALDMLGITELFPRLAGVPASRRRLILGVALTGLFCLAAVESSLAILRELIVEADAALKLSLAGEGAAVAEASASRIPVVGQAVLGFVLPWILAMVAIPLEMLLDSGRHVVTQLAALALSGLGSLAHGAGHAARSLSHALPNLYDVYIAIPLRIEQVLRTQREQHARGGKRAPRRRVREESLA